MNGEPWRTQSWLAELGYAIADDWIGLDAARLYVLVGGMTALVLLGLLVYQVNGSRISTVVYLAASSLLLAPFLNPRPVIFSFALFAAVVLASYEKSLRWSLPFLVWLWASVHGSFPIGLAYLGLFAVQQHWRGREWGTLIGAGIASLTTAHGWGVVQILFDFTRGRDALGWIQEWSTPDLLSPPYIPLLAAMFGLIFLGQKGMLKSRDWLIIVPFVVLALTATRSIPMGWIGLTPLVSRLVLPLRESTARPVLVGMIMSGLVVLSFIGAQRNHDVATELLPVGAAAELETNRVFHSDVSGGWMIYAQWPDRRVYLDDRAELYRSQMVTAAEVLTMSRDWQPEFRKWQIGEALLKHDDPLTRGLLASGWIVTYQDDTFVILRPPS